MLAAIADELKLDATHRLLPVDFGDVCLNYDKKWFAAKGLAPGSRENPVPARPFRLRENDAAADYCRAGNTQQGIGEL